MTLSKMTLSKKDILCNVMHQNIMLTENSLAKNEPKPSIQLNVILQNVVVPWLSILYKNN